MKGIFSNINLLIILIFFTAQSEIKAEVKLSCENITDVNHICDDAGASKKVKLRTILNSKVSAANKISQSKKIKFSKSKELIERLKTKSCDQDRKKSYDPQHLEVQKLIDKIKDRLLKSSGLKLNDAGLRKICMNQKTWGVGHLGSKAGIDGNIEIYFQDILKLESEDGLAFVIAHEIAHLFLKHGELGSIDYFETCGLKKHYTKCYKEHPELVKRIENRESEADLVSLWLMYLSGYNISSGKELFQTKGLAHFSREQTNNYQTHPSAEFRINFIERVAKDLNGKTGEKTPRPFSRQLLEKVASSFEEDLLQFSSNSTLAVDLIIRRAERQHYVDNGTYVQNREEVLESLRHCYVKGWTWLSPSDGEFWSSLLPVAILGETDDLKISCVKGEFGFLEVKMSMSRALSKALSTE